MKSSVNCVASLSLRTLLLIVKFLILSVYHVGNFIHVLCSMFVTMSEDTEFWALTQPMVVNVADTKKDRMRNRPEMCFFQVIAGVFISLIRESLRCFRESGCMSFSGWRSLLCLSSGGSLADLPGYPYPAYYGPLSIPRPRTVAPRHLLSRAAGL